MNLQDSSVLISYDIAWAADTIIQRAGRIMRFWPSPRTVKLYCFTTDKSLNLHVGPVASRPSQRLQMLEARLDAATHLTEIPILPDEAASFPLLGDLSSIRLADSGELNLSLFEAPELSEVSPILEDFTLLNKHHVFASSLPDDIVTAMVTPKVQGPLLVSIVRTPEGEQLLRYDPQRNQVSEITEDHLFHLLRCEETTSVADVDAGLIETLRHKSITRWKEGRDEAATIQHVCSAYLVPEEAAGGLLRAHVT